MGLFRAKWTDNIHEEWSSNLLEKRPELSGKLDRTISLMNSALPDAMIEGFEGIIDSLYLPDRNDRHVLAAAICGRCDAIVTFNLKDFPEKYLKQFNIEVLHPDEFIFHQLGLNQANVLISVQQCRKRLKNPELNADQYLEMLDRQGLSLTVSELMKFATIL